MIKILNKNEGDDIGTLTFYKGGVSSVADKIVESSSNGNGGGSGGGEDYVVNEEGGKVQRAALMSSKSNFLLSVTDDICGIMPNAVKRKRGTDDDIDDDDNDEEGGGSGAVGGGAVEIIPKEYTLELLTKDIPTMYAFSKISNEGVKRPIVPSSSSSSSELSSSFSSSHSSSSSSSYVKINSSISRSGSFQPLPGTASYRSQLHTRLLLDSSKPTIKPCRDGDVGPSLSANLSTMNPNSDPTSFSNIVRIVGKEIKSTVAAAAALASGGGASTHPPGTFTSLDARGSIFKLFAIRISAYSPTRPLSVCRSGGYPSTLDEARHVSMRELVGATGKDERELRAVLDESAVYVRNGEFKQRYTLKEEYRPAKW